MDSGEFVLLRIFAGVMIAGAVVAVVYIGCLGVTGYLRRRGR